MTSIKNAFGIAIGVVMVAAFAAALIALVLSLASTQMPGIKSAASELRCWVGVPQQGSTCMLNELAELRDEKHRLREEREKLSDMVAAQSFVFSEGEKLKDGHSLVVGTLYEDANAQTGLIRSYCWVIIDQSGLDPRVGLAVMEKDGTIHAIHATDQSRAVLNIPMGDRMYATTRCPFPDIKP
jgi:hypothetical protein